MAEALYGFSNTTAWRHFGDEFVRRKKLADKGVIEKDTVGTSVSDTKNSNNGGWNEVAKKGGSSHHNHNNNSSTPRDDLNAAGFRVVPSKKNKGKK